MKKSNLTDHSGETSRLLQTAASDSATRDRGKLILLMHNLESALAAASFNRADVWKNIVQDELVNLQTALQESRSEMNSDAGLFAEIAADHPRLINRIDNLKQKFVDLERHIATLRQQFKEVKQRPDIGDVRERMSWLLTAIRHAQAEENELVFEAIGRDLGWGD